MSYTAEISRTNPACFLFLIDQSGSMADSFPGEKRKKSQGVADALNRMLQNLVIRCAKEEGVRDYFQVGVIGYGHTVGPAFVGPLAGRDLVPISEIGTTPARVEDRIKKVDDGVGGLMDQSIRFPIWFDPIENGGTPMCQALEQARLLLKEWVGQNPNSFPPVVIHITDGESTDGDPKTAMSSLAKLETDDGNVQLFNIHISSNPLATPITFPDSAESLPDDYARKLFNGASVLTPSMRLAAREQGFTVSELSRGFVLNADLILIIQALDIGTRPSNLR